MVIGIWLTNSTRRLSNAGIGTANLDAQVLLEDVLNTNSAHLLAHPERELTPEQQKTLDAQIRRRAKHEPLAYIRGKTEFYGREFIVSSSVLEPRPESETLITLLRDLVHSRQFSVDSPLQIVDVGTGSGALAITIKLEIPNAKVIAVDIDRKCLEITKINAKKHKVEIEVLEGNLLEPLLTVGCRLSALVCNLPYVPDDFQINLAAGHEPRLAIFGGPDGLDLYRKLFAQLSTKTYNLKPKTYILTESLPTQHQEMQKIAQKCGYKLERTEDFIQKFKKS